MPQFCIILMATILALQVIVAWALLRAQQGMTGIASLVVKCRQEISAAAAEALVYRYDSGLEDGAESLAALLLRHGAVTQEQIDAAYDADDAMTA